MNDDDLKLDPITPPRSVPCAVCGYDRPYVLKAPERPVSQWAGLFRRKPRAPRESRCDWCGAL